MKRELNKTIRERDKLLELAGKQLSRIQALMRENRQLKRQLATLKETATNGKQ